MRNRRVPSPDWVNITLSEVTKAVTGDDFWENYFKIDCELVGAWQTLHLAVLVEPYLQLILEGKKTVESRFSQKRTAPFGQVKSGDAVLLKRSSGPIVGICVVSDVWYYNLDSKSLQEIRSDFARPLSALDPAFWETRKDASFATLMRIGHVRKLPKIDCHKRDRRGWVVLGSPEQLLLEPMA